MLTTCTVPCKISLFLPICYALSATLPCGAAKLLLSRANVSITLKQQNPNKILLFGLLSLSFDTKSMEHRSALDDKNDSEPVKTGVRTKI